MHNYIDHNRRIEFAKHNAEILDDRDFATIYKNAFSSKRKTLKNQPN